MWVVDFELLTTPQLSEFVIHSPILHDRDLIRQETDDENVNNTNVQATHDVIHENKNRTSIRVKSGLYVTSLTFFPAENVAYSR